MVPSENLLRQFCPGQAIQADPGLRSLKGQITMHFRRDPDRKFAAVAPGGDSLVGCAVHTLHELFCISDALEALEVGILGPDDREVGVSCC
jgi:hypothetical protein